MKLKVPDYYSRFKCIDKDCTDSCCAGWEVDVDEESYRYYETVTGEFGDRLHSVMSRDGGCHFILKPNKDCPFLNKTGLCDLFTELGEDKLCETCAMYPRFVEEYGSVREMGIAFSCKTAAELILTYEGKAGFVTSEDGKPLSSYNDINPQLYFALCEARTTAYALVQNRAYSVKERIALLLDYADKLQHSMNGHRYSNMMEHNKRYSVADADKYADMRSEELDKACRRLKRKYHTEEKSQERYRHMQKLLEIFDGLEMVKDAFPKFIENDRKTFNNMSEYTQTCREFDAYYEDREYEFEHIMVYYIFRYFLKAVYDEDLLGKVKLGVVGYIMVREMDVAWWAQNKKMLTLRDQIEITHLYSREVEHSDENFAILEEMYGTHEVFSVDNLMTAVLAD
ncbi:MAG: flagellin lysine-N-methylase [Clostridia bacterium]|nr:flagellin lysine-N-methylase [Clostridia bacterium]